MKREGDLQVTYELCTEIQVVEGEWKTIGEVFVVQHSRYDSKSSDHYTIDEDIYF